MADEQKTSSGTRFARWVLAIVALVVAFGVGYWLEELAGDRLFEDSRATEYAPEHGFLTRRAEIVLDRPGGCRVQSG